MGEKEKSLNAVAFNRNCEGEMNSDPFCKERMDEIFKVNQADDSLLISRESSSLEFKENFQWANIGKYVKTLAAFANAGGGYIVFGVKNRPHIPIGLFERKLETFESIDPERLTREMNEYFSPEIEWSQAVYDFNGKKFGVIYVKESKNKPVVCTKTSNDIFQESDIYYRYRGRSEKIKYPELRRLIDENREKEEKMWLRHISRIAKIGVKDVGIFNFKNGTTVAGNGASFLIEEKILGTLNFIKEGEFNERSGAPAIKIIGEAKGYSGIIATSSRPTIIHAKGIRLNDIVCDFLDNKKIPKPLDYLEQICCETTAMLPIYFYQKSSKLSFAELTEHLGTITTRSPSKDKLKTRLSHFKTLHTEISLSGTTAASKERTAIWKLIQTNSEINLSSGNNILRTCEVIIHLNKNSIAQYETYLRACLKKIFLASYEMSRANVSDKIRRAICWLDEALYYSEEVQ